MRCKETITVVQFLSYRPFAYRTPINRHSQLKGVFLSVGAIHSTKISGNFGPKLNGSVRSNRKSFEKTGPPFEVVLFSRSDRSEFWLNGSRPVNPRTDFRS